MTQTQLSVELLRQRKADAAYLQEHWATCIPIVTPPLNEFYRWVSIFGAAIVEQAITAAATKMSSCQAAGQPMTEDHIVRFAAGCMWTMLRRSVSNE